MGGGRQIVSVSVSAKHRRLRGVEQKGDWNKSCDVSDLSWSLPLTGTFMGISLNLSESLLPDASVEQGAGWDQQTNQAGCPLAAPLILLQPLFEINWHFFSLPPDFGPAVRIFSSPVTHQKSSWHIVVQWALIPPPQNQCGLLKYYARECIVSPLQPWFIAGFLFCFCAVNPFRVQEKAMGLPIRRKFLQTHSHKVSESLWTPKASG